VTDTSGEKAARRRTVRRQKAAETAAFGAAAEGTRTGYVAAIPGAVAAGPKAEERIIRFPHLDVAILDSMVYTTTCGLFLLGPLASAAAASKLLPPQAERPGQPDRLMAGDASAERTAIAVVSGQSSHRLVIEHTSADWTPRQIAKQVAEFNVLALQAQSLPCAETIDVFPEHAGVTVVA
jgi:hypothetical protein